MLTIDDNIAVMGEIMTDKEIVQDIRDVVEEEVQEVDEVVDEEDADESLTKPTIKEMRQAIRYPFKFFRYLLRVGKHRDDG